jgi:hypothetical protein
VLQFEMISSSCFSAFKMEAQPSQNTLARWTEKHLLLIN